MFIKISVYNAVILKYLRVIHILNFLLCQNKYIRGFLQ